MVLQDHFHPPLSLRRHWHAFHNAWATYLAADLNTRLPAGYFAEPNVQFGIEIDVAALEDTPQEGAPSALVAPLQDPTGWSPSAPSATLSLALATETVEIAIFANTGGPTLAGAIELVSPANKDRLVHRQAFVSKCATYLQQGIGLVIVDVVTGRSVNLHDALAAYLGAPEAMALRVGLYAVAYRPVERQGQAAVDIWSQPLALGQPLPILPLWLRGALCLPIMLETTYERTCREHRLLDHGV
jgi:hypothetical protein